MDDNDGCPAHYEAGLVEETEHSDEITLKPGHRTNNVLKDVIKLLIQSKVKQNKLFYKFRFLLSDKVCSEIILLSALQYTFVQCI